jgi:GNAT superfamily N-acetyltransferase
LFSFNYSTGIKYLCSIQSEYDAAMAQMLCATTDMAQRLEAADKIHLARQVETCIQIFPEQGIQLQPVGYGVAAVTLPLFGRKLNHVVGFGMGGPTSTDDLAKVEKLYEQKSIAGEIDLCPHADATAIQVLALGGYTVNGWINSYVRILTDADFQEADLPGVSILQISPDRLEEFRNSSVEGYRDGGRSELLLEALARSAELRADTSLYFATVDGKVAGSAGLALIETSKGGVAHLYIDSTLPEYRGRGIQAALLQQRLSDARKAGYKVASVQARPTTGSARNIERAGFSLAYTKATFVKT